MGFSPREDDVRGEAFERSPGPPFAIRHLESVWNRNQRPTLADTLAQASLETRLLNDYLVKVDRASMMSSLEVRSPFLDLALAEFAARLPATVRFGQGRPKHLLRRLASRLVAADSYDRPKRGFGIPIAAWLRGKLRAFATSSLLSGPLCATGLVRPDVVERLLKEHVEERSDHADRIWCLLMLDLWLARYRA
jgi:asparagine synthase (glutamine-hydrolysing)